MLMFSHEGSAAQRDDRNHSGTPGGLEDAGDGMTFSLAISSIPADCSVLILIFIKRYCLLDQCCGGYTMLIS